MQAVQFDHKDNTVNLMSRGPNDQLQKELKASHFTIGNPMGNMKNPPPIPPVETNRFTVR